MLLWMDFSASSFANQVCARRQLRQRIFREHAVMTDDSGGGLSVRLGDVDVEYSNTFKM